MTGPDDTDAPRPSAAAVLRTRGVTPMLLTSLLSVLATMIQVTALGKQVYDLTGRDLDLGLLGLAEFVPALLLMTVTGTIADRFDRRRVVAFGLAIEVVCSLALAWYVASGRSAVWPIFSLVVVFGVGRAFVSPALRSLPADLSPDGGLPRVIAFNVACWQSAAIVGPVLAGFLYVGSDTWPFLASAALAIAGLVLIGFARGPRRLASGDHAAEAAVMDLGDEYRPGETLEVLGEEYADTIATTRDDDTSVRRAVMSSTSMSLWGDSSRRPYPPTAASANPPGSASPMASANRAANHPSVWSLRARHSAEPRSVGVSSTCWRSGPGAMAHRLSPECFRRVSRPLCVHDRRRDAPAQPDGRWAANARSAWRQAVTTGSHTGEKGGA